MKTTILLFIAIVLLFTSCQRGIYIPDKVHSPGFREAGEAKLDLSVKPQRIDSNGSPVSFSSDLAYAPINHLGIMLSYRGVNNKTLTENDFWGNDNRYTRLNGSRIDVGAGYFSALGSKGKCEVYAGYGMGNIRSKSILGSGTDASFDARYNRIFLQPAFGFQTKIFSLMGGLRFTYQKYNSITSPDPNIRYSLIPNQSIDLLNQVFAFAEPFVEMQTGGKWVKFNYQMGWACQVAGPSLRYELGLPYMSIGVLFHYAPSHLKKALVKKEKSN